MQMGDRTSIQWTESSWNPIRARDLGPVGTGPGPGWHCEILTPGCNNCYAAAINKRLGTHRPYKITSRPHVHVYLDEKMLTQPLRWKKPRRIFVASMSDLFGDWVTDEMLKQVFRAMSQAPQHTYQILTKRAARQREFMISWVLSHLRQPPSNWWFGVSVEDQRRADERIPVLLDTPAAMRWISAEPLLAPVDLTMLHDGITNIDALAGLHGVGRPHSPGPRLDWVVVGGESGSGARPFCIGWGRALIEECAAAGVPVFMKQIGAKPYPWAGKLRDRKGGDMTEFPHDLRIREYPNAGTMGEFLRTAIAEASG